MADPITGAEEETQAVITSPHDDVGDLVVATSSETEPADLIVPDDEGGVPYACTPVAHILQPLLIGDEDIMPSPANNDDHRSSTIEETNVDTADKTHTAGDDNAPSNSGGDQVYQNIDPLELSQLHHHADVASSENAQEEDIYQARQLASSAVTPSNIQLPLEPSTEPRRHEFSKFVPKTDWQNGHLLLDRYIFKECNVTNLLW